MNASLRSLIELSKCSRLHEHYSTALDSFCHKTLYVLWSVCNLLSAEYNNTGLGLIPFPLRLHQFLFRRHLIPHALDYSSPNKIRYILFYGYIWDENSDGFPDFWYHPSLNSLNGFGR